MSSCKPSFVNGPLGLTVTGPRSVIVPADPVIWSESTSYEYLTLVASTDFGQAYISKRDVPAGTPLTDDTYWIPAAQFNAQLAEILRQMGDVTSDVSDLKASDAAYNGCDPMHYGADPTGAKDSTTAIQNCIDANAGGMVRFTPGVYLVTSPLTTDYIKRTAIDFNGAVILFQPSSSVHACLEVGYDNATTAHNSSPNSGNFPPSAYFNGTIVCNANADYAIAVRSWYLVSYVHDMTIVTPNSGIEMAQEHGNPIDSRVDRCFITNVGGGTSATHYGINFNATDNNISQCRIYNFNVQVRFTGGDNLSDCHFLGTTINDSLNGIGIELANEGLYTVSNYYNDAIKTAIKISAEYVNLTCTACQAYTYTAIDDECFIDMSEYERGTVSNILGLYVAPAHRSGFTVIKYVNAERAANYQLQGTVCGVVGSMVASPFDLGLVTNELTCNATTANQWTLVGYTIQAGYKHLRLLVASGSFTSVVDINYNSGTNPTISVNNLSGTMPSGYIGVTPDSTYKGRCSLMIKGNDGRAPNLMRIPTACTALVSRTFQYAAGLATGTEPTVVNS